MIKGGWWKLPVEIFLSYDILKSWQYGIVSFGAEFQSNSHIINDPYHLNLV